MALNRLISVSARVSAHGGRRYPDAYIEHWGEIYARNTWLRDIGVTFEMFLEQPDRVLASPTCQALMPSPVDHFYPLLPQQRAVQARIDAERAFPELFAA